MNPHILKARKETMDEALEHLLPDEFDIAEKYVDLFIDFFEEYEQGRIPEGVQSIDRSDVRDNEA